MNENLIFQFPIHRKLVSYECWQVSLFQEWLHDWTILCILNNTCSSSGEERVGYTYNREEAAGLWAFRNEKGHEKTLNQDSCFQGAFLLLSLCFIKVTGKTCIALYRDKLFRGTNTLTVIPCKTSKTPFLFLALVRCTSEQYSPLSTKMWFPGSPCLMT